MEHINSNSKINYLAFKTPMTSIITFIINDRNDALKKIIGVQETPFHPVSYQWPDQPGDKGNIHINNTDYLITDTIIVALSKQKNEFYIDKEIPVKMHENDWIFLVGHVVVDDKNILNSDQVGINAVLTVDKNFRNALNTAHTACHLSSLALNKVTNNYWKKEVIKDSLSHFNFDTITIEKSDINEYFSLDTYRLSKSARKKGLDTHLVINDISQIEEKINVQLKNWLADKIIIDVSPSTLSSLCDRREWRCSLSDGNAVIPCGGTHITNFNKISEINVTLNIDEDNVSMRMKTSIKHHEE